MAAACAGVGIATVGTVDDATRRRPTVVVVITIVVVVGAIVVVVDDVATVVVDDVATVVVDDVATVVGAASAAGDLCVLIRAGIPATPTTARVTMATAAEETLLIMSVPPRPFVRAMNMGRHGRRSA